MTIPAPEGFNWHCDKFEANIAKHRVRFEVAVEAFDDHNALEGYDPSHSFQEDRYWLVGRADGQILRIAFSIEDGAEGGLITHLISARLAEKGERHAYATQTT